MTIALAPSSLGYSGATQTWYQVFEAKRRVDKQTDLFQITASKWRVSWERSGKGLLGSFVRTKDRCFQLMEWEDPYLFQTGCLGGKI